MFLGVLGCRLEQVGRRGEDGESGSRAPLPFLWQINGRDQHCGI
jgi:hypothetical protein